VQLFCVNNQKLGIKHPEMT